jgi:hypothetical protein
MFFRKHDRGSGECQTMGVEEPRQHVLPDSAWQGQTGNFLRKLGLTPDDESNLLPTAQSIRARIERDRARHEQKLTEINNKLAQVGSRVRPFFLIPDPCWNGPAGNFLMMQLELFPYDDWNVAFLPADERSAFILNGPPHPGGNIPAIVSAAEKFLREAEAHLRAAHAEAGKTHDVESFVKAKEAAKGKVRGLAAYFEKQLIDIWKHNHPRGPGASAAK